MPLSPLTLVKRSIVRIMPTCNVDCFSWPTSVMFDISLFLILREINRPNCGNSLLLKKPDAPSANASTLVKGILNESSYFESKPIPVFITPAINSTLPPIRAINPGIVNAVPNSVLPLVNVSNAAFILPSLLFILLNKSAVIVSPTWNERPSVFPASAILEISLSLIKSAFIIARSGVSLAEKNPALPSVLASPLVNDMLNAGLYAITPFCRSIAEPAVILIAPPITLINCLIAFTDAPGFPKIIAPRAAMA